MTKETKHKIKKSVFAEFREGGVAMMSSLGLPWTVRDDWEVMSKSIDYALTHANKPGERGTAVMALAMWMHGYLECKTLEEISKADDLIAAEDAIKKTITPAK